MLNDDVPGRGHGVFCRPAPGFSASLTPFSAREGSTVDLRLAGRDLRVPRAYRPETHAEWRSLTVLAAPPSFEPMGRAANGLEGLERFESMVWFDLRPESGPNFFDFGPTGVPDDRLGLDRLAPLPEETGARYYTQAADGRPDSLISCSHPAAPRPSCQHRFLRDGVLYTFNHPVSDLPRWREMRERLAGLLAGFEAAARP